MKVPFSYIFRNLWTRKLTTILTASGMGLVVFVFAAVLMLDAGLKQTMVGTGTLDNVLAIRTGAEPEIQSGITRDQAGLLEAMPQVARSKTGEPLISKETLVLISLIKSGQEKGSNVIVRGVSPMGITLRPQVKLVQGRMFRPGASELVVGRNINGKFDGAEIGTSYSKTLPQMFGSPSTQNANRSFMKTSRGPYRCSSRFSATSLPLSFRSVQSLAQPSRCTHPWQCVPLKSALCAHWGSGGHLFWRHFWASPCCSGLSAD